MHTSKHRGSGRFDLAELAVSTLSNFIYLTTVYGLICIDPLFLGWILDLPSSNFLAAWFGGMTIFFLCCCLRKEADGSS
ncbi:MAG: hypothetical protein ACE5NN_03095 [Candidatus Bathyarchaeia archaeon]